MRRNIVVMLCAVVLAIGVAGVLDDADASGAHGFSTTWCNAPEVIPLAELNIGTVVTTENVVTSRGTSGFLGSEGPAIRMNDPGSRVQITFDQPLFFTQILFSNIDAADSVRVDASLGNSRQAIDASSVRGSLVRAEEQSALGLTAEARSQPDGRGQIDLFVGATELLLTNEGDTSIDVLGAIGCPALELSSETVSSPTWDVERQEFVAEYEVTFSNRLANPRTSALRLQESEATTTTIDDLTIDVAFDSPGFSSARAGLIRLSPELERRRNIDFDGVGNRSLLDTPLELTNGEDQTIRLEVGFTPDFNDPAWAEGVAAPAPSLQIRGAVDDISVAVGGRLIPEGVDLEAIDTLVAPNPSVRIEHELVGEPLSGVDGVVTTSERIEVINTGEAAIAELLIDYSLLDLWGEGTQILAIDGRATGGCSGLFSSVFTGAGANTVLFDADGLDVDGRCTVDLEVQVLPGVIPTESGVEYETAVTASARSGARQVSDIVAVRTEIAQASELLVSLESTESTNLRDGRYRFEGSLTIQNTGDQNLSGVASRIDITNGQGESAEPANVVFEEIVGTEQCGVAGGPAVADSGVLLSDGVTLSPGETCEFDYSMIVRPGSRLTDWQVSALATMTTPRGIAIQTTDAEDFFGIDESPEVEASVAVVNVINVQNGDYILEVDTTLANAGDTPLVEAETAIDAAGAFGARLINQERTANTCSAVEGGSPLAASVTEGSCVVRERLTVRPLGQLDGWFLDGEVIGRSTSTAQVQAEATSEEIVFTESPAISSTITVSSTEKLSNDSIQVRLLGSIENTGNIELRAISNSLDLDEIFNGAETSIEQIGAQGVTISPSFDGVRSDEMLTLRDALPAGTSAQWDMTVVVTTGTDPGPFDIVSEAGARSPSRAAVSLSPRAVSQAIPIIGVVERSFTSENNNDGTYSVEHVLGVQNSGGSDLSTINVSTDIETLFDGLILGEVTTLTSCGSTVRVGNSCTLTQRATIRPGSANGPYSVTSFIDAADDEGLLALVAPEPEEASSISPVVFDEAPAIELGASFDNLENLGDGTYRVAFDFNVRNTGDVPLYGVQSPDPIQTTFGETIVGNTLVEDSCGSVSFANPLLPNGECTRSHDVVIRPLDALGPWDVEYDVTGQSPSLATVNASEEADSLTFEETVGLVAESRFESIDNRGDGRYEVTLTLEVENTSDVPLVSVAIDEAVTSYEQVRTDRTLRVDSCSLVSSADPLAPGATCRVEIDDVVEPGAALGPYTSTTRVIGRSPSQETIEVEAETAEVTFTERPAVTLETRITSVETVEAETFRIVTALDLQNTGDVRIDDLDLSLDLDEMFPDSVYRIDGVISDDFEINEAFGLQESTSLLVPGQALFVGQTATVTMVLSIEPAAESGPFTGELSLVGTSPAEAETNAVIDAQIDLPSVATEIVTQSVNNNQDGSYTVTTSYAIENDGSTDLEFVRLRENLAEIYAGATARVLSIDSPDLTAFNLEEGPRGDDLLEWGVGLGAGDRAVVTSTVLVTPGNQLGPFQAAIAASALSPAGTPVATEELGIDRIVFVEQPALRVEQRLLRRPEWNITGRFDVTFEIDVINDGDVELRGLQVREDLLAALGANARISVRDVRSETLTVNRGFDGIGRPPAEPVIGEDGEPIEQPVQTQRDIGDTRLLGGLDTLAAGETATIELDLTITPETRGVFNTRIVVAARTPAGTGVGSDGDVIEATTLTRLSVQGELGLAKRTIGEPSVRPDGSVGVSYEILVENVGPFPLTNVEVHDQLSQAFGLGSTFVTSTVRVDAGSPCVGFASSSFDGGAVDPVLVSGAELAPNEQCRIQYDVAVLPANALPGPFRSSAFAIASDPFSGTVIDDSTDGTNTDPDGNQEPGDNDIATSVRVEVPDPAVELTVEPLESLASERDGWHEFGYRLVLDNTGPIDIDTTRLLAPLDDEWSVPFEVLAISSDDVIVNEDFDGGRQQNLLDRRNRLRAGSQAEITVLLRSAIPREGDLAVDFGLFANSVVGSPFEVQADTVVVEPNGSTSSSLGEWFEAMTTEEQRLIGLGAGVITLFVLIFIFTAVRKTRRLLAKAPKPETEELIDLREAEIEPVIDVRELEDEDDDEEVLPRPSVNLESPTEAHYRPRRRRGHRRVKRESLD